MGTNGSRIRREDTLALPLLRYGVPARVPVEAKNVQTKLSDWGGAVLVAVGNLSIFMLLNLRVNSQIVKSTQPNILSDRHEGSCMIGRLWLMAF